MADPELRAKLTPTYTPGCKRLLQSNDYYPALQRPNVTVETEKIIALRPEGVVTADGALHEVDTIIYGTGFRVTNNPDGRTGSAAPTAVRSRSTGPARGMRAYRGTTIPGFPNYFMLAGPNTGIGHTSLVVMIEAQVAHVVGALRALRHGASGVIDVRPEVLRRVGAPRCRPRRRRRSGTRAGARAGISMTPAATPRSGPTTPSASSAATRTFDPGDYVLSGGRLGRSGDRAYAAP